MESGLRVDAKKEANAVAHDLIRDQKENRGDKDHHEHHHGGDSRLLARRPRDLLRLGPHFLQELEWVDLRHGQQIVLGSLNRYSPPASGGNQYSRPFGECSPRKSVTGPPAMAASYRRAPGSSSEETLTGRKT